jgi:hypothetical protein
MKAVVRASSGRQQVAYSAGRRISYTNQGARPWYTCPRGVGCDKFHGLNWRLHQSKHAAAAAAAQDQDDEVRTKAEVSQEYISNKVTRLLEIVGTESDGSREPGEKEKREADDIINELEEIGQGRRPLEDPMVFGNYNVSYVSMGSRQYGQPAGGRFRTGLGKLLFRTTGLYQSVIQPNVVTNKIEFKVFGFIPCSVGLRGTLRSIPEKKGGEDCADTAKVFFEPPVLTLPFGIHTSFGPESNVVLKTTYVDDRVRLGKGSRGSLFVFTRGGESENAGMDLVGLQKIQALGKVLISLAVVGMFSGGAALSYYYYANPLIGGLGMLLMFLSVGLGFGFWRGGIFDDSIERPEVTPLPAS